MGISFDGSMASPGSPYSNAVLCSPGGGVLMQQYHFLSPSFAGIVPDPTPGTSGLACSQNNGQTVMQWTRGVNNGNPADAQVVTNGTTNIIFAVGRGSVFNATFPDMDGLAVTLVPTVYANSASLTPGLTLNWNVNGDSIDFQAVFEGSAWCVLQCGSHCVCCVIAGRT